MRYLVFIILFVVSLCARAQELNVKLTVNTQNIQSVSPDLVAEFKEAILQLFNEQKWSSTTFSRTERIDCIVSITITEMPSEGKFKGEVAITTRRPVYNSAYVTPMLNYKDTQLEFDYSLGQSVYYTNNSTNNNLVSIIAFYSYIAIGMDFDSFSLNGGRPYFEKAMEIANMAQTLNVKGWEPFAGSKGNRYDLAIALTDESTADFHALWYNYHRMGLDEMAANASRGRIRILESIAHLQKVYESRPSSVLLTIFGESKLDELIKICTEATGEEKKEMRTLLLKIFPAKSTVINNGLKN